MEDLDFALISRRDRIKKEREERDREFAADVQKKLNGMTVEERELYEIERKKKEEADLALAKKMLEEEAESRRLQELVDAGAARLAADRFKEEEEQLAAARLKAIRAASSPPRSPANANADANAEQRRKAHSPASAQAAAVAAAAEEEENDWAALLDEPDEDDSPPPAAPPPEPELEPGEPGMSEDERLALELHEQEIIKAMKQQQRIKSASKERQRGVSHQPLESPAQRQHRERQQQQQPVVEMDDEELARRLQLEEEEKVVDVRLKRAVSEPVHQPHPPPGPGPRQAPKFKVNNTVELKSVLATVGIITGHAVVQAAPNSPPSVVGGAKLPVVEEDKGKKQKKGKN